MVMDVLVGLAFGALMVVCLGFIHSSLKDEGD